MIKYKKNQEKTPLYDELLNYINHKVIPFHVPGHKMGRGIHKELKSFIGENMLSFDITLLDQIQEALEKAQCLAAEVFNADHTLFTVNGTSNAIQNMIMSVVNNGDKIIIPRNIHKSVVAGLIMSGADPVYIIPEYDQTLGIVKNVTPNAVEMSLKQNKDVKAVLVTNPSYNGICTELKKISEIVHSYNIPFVVDEAHGSHLQFSEKLPFSAMDSQVDISAQSTHKNLCSLTQSSMLHIREGWVDVSRIKKTMSTFQTTSPSCILLMSLDYARYQVAKKGEFELKKIIELSKLAQERINRMNGFFCINNEMIGDDNKFRLDDTKITIGNHLGISGLELEDILFSNYHIQIDCSDFNNILCFFTLGDTEESVMALMNALEDIERKSIVNKRKKNMVCLPDIPPKRMTPREAFFAPTRICSINESVNKVSAELIMTYPPGIPILSPGEVITKDIVKYIELLKNQKFNIVGLEYPHSNGIRVIV